VRNLTNCVTVFNISDFVTAQINETYDVSEIASNFRKAAVSKARKMCNGKNGSFIIATPSSKTLKLNDN
jgi:hypothetical protein